MRGVKSMAGWAELATRIRKYRKHNPVFACPFCLGSHEAGQRCKRISQRIRPKFHTRAGASRDGGLSGHMSQKLRGKF